MVALFTLAVIDDVRADNHMTVRSCLFTQTDSVFRHPTLGVEKEIQSPNNEWSYFFSNIDGVLHFFSKLSNC